MLRIMQLYSVELHHHAIIHIGTREKCFFKPEIYIMLKM